MLGVFSVPWGPPHAGGASPVSTLGDQEGIHPAWGTLKLYNTHPSYVFLGRGPLPCRATSSRSVRKQNRSPISLNGSRCWKSP